MSPTYKGMTPPLIQNLKTIGLWVFFLIYYLTFLFLFNMKLKFTLEYLTLSISFHWTLIFHLLVLRFLQLIVFHVSILINSFPCKYFTISSLYMMLTVNWIYHLSLREYEDNDNFCDFKKHNDVNIECVILKAWEMKKCDVCMVYF